ncbi:MAG: caspase family protein [Pleurocapsa sp. MO_226.B13]|nr:caspase family protein [Pleurocapsa sp. MO_226.B13]
MTNKAVLCGINNYKTITDLRGCLNDVQNIFELLTQVYNFEPSQIHQLIDEQVTKAAIKNEYNWLLQEAQKGDRLVFHFSGHGSYVPDDNGDEVDSTDEITCLYDMDFYNSETFMRDDEWRVMIQQVPQDVELTFILDNCHSGTGTRVISVNLQQGRDRKLAIDVATSERRSSESTVKALAAIDIKATPTVGTRAATLEQLDRDTYENLVGDRNVILPRFIAPPAEFQEQIIATARTRGLKSRAKELEKHLLLAGCRDDQTAADAYIDGDFHGAFTYYLCQTLRQSPDLGSQETINRVAKLLKINQFQQIPQHEGTHRSGSIFGNQSSISISTDNNMTRPPSISPANSNLTAENQKLLIEAYLKLLDTIAGAAEPRAKIARQIGDRYLVYVHGISQHRHGYSNGWWNALKRFVEDIFGNGDLGGTRQEVLWSDLVNARALVDESQQQQLRREIELVLEERRTQTIAANTGGGGDARRAVVQSSVERGGGFAIDDFLIYMLNSNVRQQIIDRFTEVVRPLLENGSQIDIISHSWGTVVAYEGLRELEKMPLSGRVTTLFSVGSALSISPVRARLREENKDGNRPANVEQWLNLDSQGDLVGGMLGDKFDVTQEYLDLEPTGCSRFLGIYNPGCAHSSYFSHSNTAVNRDIFAQHITS